MAVTLTLLSVSPNAMKYLYSYDGAGGVGSGSVVKTQAELVADAKTAGPGPSPLAALLETTTVGATWNALPRTAQLSLLATIATTNVNGTGPVARLIDAPNRLIVDSVDAHGNTTVVEIRFNITPSR